MINIDSIAQLYAINLENCKSLTVFKCIDAAGNFPPLLLIVISKQKIMVDWFLERIFTGTCIILSENRFISDKIALEFLQYYISNSDCGSDAD